MMFTTMRVQKNFSNKTLISHSHTFEQINPIQLNEENDAKKQYAGRVHQGLLTKKERIFRLSLHL